MTILHWLIYIAVGAIAGLINAVAGGGSLILFPVLLGVGLPPITANTTMSLIIQPGVISSVYGYRKHIRKLPKHYFLLIIPCFIGGLLGAIILVKTSTVAFEHIVPYFMAFAVILMLFQPRIHKWLYTSRGRALQKRHHITAIISVAAVFIVISLYGGYFGAGFGIITLACLGLTQLTDLQQMNGLKNVAALGLGVADCAYFIAHGLIDWRIVPTFLIGNLVGGYVGSIYGAKLPARKLRICIIVISAIITVALFYKFNK